MAEIMSKISVVSFILAAVCIVLTILLWFQFKIPVIIGDLSGRTAKKSIERIRKENEKSGKKRHMPSFTNQERGKLTEKIDAKGIGRTVSPSDFNVTEKLSEQNIQDEATELLEQETSVLDDNTTQVLQETTGENDAVYNWKLVDDVMIIHTDEVIQ